MTTDATIITGMTNAGLAVMAQSQLGKTVTFTKVQIGDGTITTQELATLAGLINPLALS